MRLNARPVDLHPLARRVTGTLTRPGSAVPRPSVPASAPDAPRALRRRADGVLERIVALEREQLVGLPPALEDVEALTGAIAALDDAIVESRARHHGPEALGELFAARRALADGLVVVADLLARLGAG